MKAPRPTPDPSAQELGLTIEQNLLALLFGGLCILLLAGITYPFRKAINNFADRREAKQRTVRG